MSRCANIQKQISLLYDNRLSESKAHVVRTHLATCSACSEELAQMGSALSTLDVLAPQKAREGGWDRFVALQARQPVPRPLFNWRWAYAGAAAAVAIGAVAFGLLQSRDSQVVSKPPRIEQQQVQPEPSLVSPPPALVEKPSPEVALQPGPAPQPKLATSSPAPRSEPPRRTVRPRRYVQRDRAPAKPVVKAAPAPPSPVVVEPADAASQTAELLDSGLEPLVEIAESKDPLSWLSELDNEDWL